MTSKTLWGTFWSPSGTLKWLGYVFLYFGRAWGSIWVPPGPTWAPFGHPWAPLGPTWGLFSSLLTTLGRALDPFGNFGATVTKKVPKLIQNGTRNGVIFNDILSLCEKWQTAFGLRLRGRIGVRASCFHPLGVNLCPLFFSRFFGRENAVTEKVQRQRQHPLE